MVFGRKDKENLDRMNERMQKKKKPSFWGGVRKGMQARSEENKKRRDEENRIRQDAFIKARHSEIKRQGAAKGRASVRGMTYTARGNYNPIGALFDTGMKPAPTRRKTSSKKSKKGKKKKSSSKKNNNFMSFDPVDNWGMW